MKCPGNAILLVYTNMRANIHHGRSRPRKSAKFKHFLLKPDENPGLDRTLYVVDEILKLDLNFNFLII